MTLQKRIVIATACVCVLAGFTRSAEAQAVASSFGELAANLKPGRTVYVTDEAGRKISGRIIDLSTGSLKLLSGAKQETFAEDRVRQITERRRYPGKGAKFGFAIGGALGFLATVNVSCPQNRCEGLDSPGAIVVMALGLGGIGAGIGAGIGVAITHERPIYRAPNPHPAATVALAPVVSKRGTGFAASVRF